MKKNLLTLLVLLLTCGMVYAHHTEVQTPRPAPRQIKWHEAELGVVFHYDLHVFDGQVYGQGNNRINPIEDYNIFHPDKLDTDQWIQAAKAAGAKFAVLTRHPRNRLRTLAKRRQPLLSESRQMA